MSAERARISRSLRAMHRQASAHPAPGARLVAQHLKDALDALRLPSPRSPLEPASQPLAPASQPLAPTSQPRSPRGPRTDAQEYRQDQALYDRLVRALDRLYAHRQQQHGQGSPHITAHRQQQHGQGSPHITAHRQQQHGQGSPHITRAIHSLDEAVEEMDAVKETSWEAFRSSHSWNTMQHGAGIRTHITVDDHGRMVMTASDSSAPGPAVKQGEEEEERTRLWRQEEQESSEEQEGIY